MKAPLVLISLVVSLATSSAQLLVPGPYEGWVTSPGGKDYKLSLEVWADGAVACALRAVDPITGSIVRSFSGEGVNKPNGLIRGGMHGSGTWRGKVDENRTNATIRVYLRRGFAAQFNVQLVPATPLPPGGGSGGVIIVRPPLWPVNPPVVVLPPTPLPPVVIPPPIIAEPPPAIPPPIVPITPGAGAVLIGQRRFVPPYN